MHDSRSMRENLAQTPILVISLPGSTRLGRTLKRLQELSLDAEIFAGIDGERLDPANFEELVDQSAAIHHLGERLSQRQVGCALSHRRAIAELEVRNAQWGVILEDDAIVQEDFVSTLVSIGSWTTARPTLVSFFTVWPASVRLAKPSKTTSRGQEQTPPSCIAKLRWPVASAVAYAMNRPAIKLANQWYAKHRIFTRADWPPWASKLDVFLASGWCVEHEEGRTTIHDATPGPTGRKRAGRAIQKAMLLPYLRAPAPYDYDIRWYLQDCWLPSISGVVSRCTPQSLRRPQA